MYFLHILHNLYYCASTNSLHMLTSQVKLEQEADIKQTHICLDKKERKQTLLAVQKHT
jgi:hypothetical protein